LSGATEYKHETHQLGWSVFWHSVETRTAGKQARSVRSWNKVLSKLYRLLDWSIL